MCNKGCIVCRDKAVFHRSFPFPILQGTVHGLRPSKEPRLSSAHFSILPRVQVLIKPVEGLGELGRVVAVGVGGVKGTNSSSVLVCDLISAMLYCHTHPSSCSIIAAEDLFKSKMSFWPQSLIYEGLRTQEIPQTSISLPDNFLCLVLFISPLVCLSLSSPLLHIFQQLPVLCPSYFSLSSLQINF